MQLLFPVRVSCKQVERIVQTEPEVITNLELSSRILQAVQQVTVGPCAHAAFACACQRQYLGHWCSANGALSPFECTVYQVHLP